MGRRRYRGYRGRPAAWDVIKLVVVVLAVVLVLAAGGLMLAQRYIMYTDDGVRLELPFFAREQRPAPDVSVPLDIVQRPRLPREEPEADEGELNID